MTDIVNKINSLRDKKKQMIKILSEQFDKEIDEQITKLKETPAPINQPTKCTVYILPMYKIEPIGEYEGESNFTDLHEPDKIKEHILLNYPDLILKFKHGDMIEDAYTGGYRSEGIYFISKENTNGLDFDIIRREIDYDEYGHVPSKFLLLDQFPIGHWVPENCNVDNTHSPGSKLKLYWHSNDYPEGFISLKDCIVSVKIDEEGYKIYKFIKNNKSYEFKAYQEVDLTKPIYTCYENGQFFYPY